MAAILDSEPPADGAGSGEERTKDERRRHIPVLVEEVLSLLRCEPHRIYVDATLGGGGHALEILKQTAPDGKVIGIEWDEDAISEAREVLMPFGDRIKIVRENFVHMPAILNLMKVDCVDGILLDLGLSSIQLGKKERGFSLKQDGPLDMRMDQRMEMTAADLVHRLSEADLVETLTEYGEEPWAKRIAKAIVEERKKGPLETTQALRRTVTRAIPRRFQFRRIDPATKTFQALRIRVNGELENLKQMVERGWCSLRKGGRFCVISFHSLEDRIVKETFRTLEREGKGVRVVTRKPIRPSQEERVRNPRCRSAKLRCVESV
jgi:16S rRNA (cytosine1402-N4)-methyltransferase